LPTTGAWSGSIVAWLLGLERKKAFAFISAGVLLAGIVVGITTKTILSLPLP
jgi:uncharacterized membrane protein